MDVLRQNYARIRDSRDKEILPQGEAGGGLWVRILMLALAFIDRALGV
jgi:hypothetical protein